MRSGDVSRDLIISLLHATYRAGERAVGVREEWLGRAFRPSRVEHVFSLDEDDEISVAATGGLSRVVNPAAPGVTAVRNWNAAAKAASGDLLFVIADDLTPPHGWDVTLDRLIGRLDPRRIAFAVRVADIEPSTDSRPWLMRQPVVSRRYYEELGLFDDEYTGLFCDDDITLRSFWYAVVLDGSSLVLSHRRDVDQASASQERINTDVELARGRMLRDRQWGSFRPPARAAFFPVPPVRLFIGPMALFWRWHIRVRAWVVPARRLLTRVSVASAIRVARARAWLEGVTSRD
jgi:hypothetical protein